MRYEDEQESSNVQDDRGQSFGGGGGGGFGGGGFGLPIGIGGGGLGVVVVIILALVFGVDPSRLLGGGGSGPQTAPPPGYQQPGYQGPADQVGAQPGARADDVDASFSKRVLKMTEETWGDVFAERGQQYPPPTLVLYDEVHPTACGTGQAAMGPFYCPGDRKVYLDLAFFKELSGRFGAPGRFAEAYVIAHEVGHHVQNLLGTSDKVDAARQGGRREANQASVRLELQADCYAGVWANRTNQRRRFLDPGDVDQGLAAASAVGDDTLQKETQGRVVPDAFTHGSSAQRVKWFKAGFERGDMAACDTFSPAYEDL